MHILQLAKQDDLAQKRMRVAAQALATHFKLEPSLAQGLIRQEKDLPVRSMMEREAIANLLEALAHKVGAFDATPSPAEKPPVTAVTDELETKPVDESIPVSSVDGLPAPMLDETPSEPLPESAAWVGRDEPELFVPDAAGSIITPAKPEPKKKASKRSTGTSKRRTSKKQ